jgi:uncharacterized protein YutE (UPF0331/DUF86 family)
MMDCCADLASRIARDLGATFPFVDENVIRYLTSVLVEKPNFDQLEAHIDLIESACGEERKVVEAGQ